MSIITDYKPLAAIFKKVVATLSQMLQRIHLRIPQCRVRIIYKPGPNLFIGNRLSRQNHNEHKDEEITGMQVNINTIQTTTTIPEYMMICELQQQTSQDSYSQQLKEQVIKGWPENKDQIAQNFRPYWMFQVDMVVIDGFILKGRGVVIPVTLQKTSTRITPY